MNNVINFETGKTYGAFCASDYSSALQMTVISRTANTISFMQYGRQVTKRITICNSAEYVKMGSRSMSPIWSADRDEHGNRINA